MPRDRLHADTSLPRTDRSRQAFLIMLSLGAVALGALLFRLPPAWIPWVTGLGLGAVLFRITIGHVLMHWWAYRSTQLIHMPKVPPTQRPARRQVAPPSLHVIHRSEKPARRVLG